VGPFGTVRSVFKGTHGEETKENPFSGRNVNLHLRCERITFQCCQRDWFRYFIQACHKTVSILSQTYSQFRKPTDTTCKFTGRKVRS